MSMDLSKAATAPAWLSRKRSETCLLCGGPTEFVCVWQPGPGDSIRHPRGGTRLIVYSLCGTCARHADDRMDEIEGAIVAQLAGAGMVPMN